GAVPQLGLEDDGHGAVRAEGAEVQAGQAAQLFRRRAGRLEFPAGALQEGAEGGVNGRHEDLFLVAEVKVDGAVGDAGAFGDLRDARLKETVFGDDGDGGVKNPLVLFATTAGRVVGGAGACGWF